MFRIDVFISSKINGHKRERKNIKKTLQKKLKEIIQDVYIFEDYGASSTNLEDSYLEYVKKCDLYILIVWNSDEISEPTYKEFLLAKQMNKHMLIFFIKDCEKETLIQRKLREMDIDKTVKYDEIVDEKQLIKRILDSVGKDVAREYKKAYVNEKYDLGTAMNYITVCDNSTLAKFLPKSFESGSIQSISFDLNDLFNTIQITKEKDKLNNSMDIFISNIFYESKFDVDNFDLMNEEILELHTEQQRSIVEKRLNAIKFYYSGLYKDANKSMHDALSKTNKSDWLYNNISIDIRNFDKVDEFGLEGQRLLENSTNPTYFPLLDRYFTNIENDLYNFFKKESFNNVNERGFVNYNKILIEISKAIKLAIFYGSLTYLIISIEKFYEFCEFLYLKDKNPMIAALVYKGYILNRKKKNLDTFSIKCACLDFVYTDITLNKLLDLISNINDRKSQIEAKMLVLRFFGYSLQKNIFKSLIFEILNDDNKIYYGSSDFLIKCEIIESVYLRLSNQEILDFIFKNFMSIKQIEVFNRIFNLIEYKRLNDNEKEQMFTFFNSKIDEKWNNYSFTRIIFLFVEETGYKRDDILMRLLKNNAEGVSDFNAFITDNKNEICSDIKKCITSLKHLLNDYENGIISYDNNFLISKIVYHTSKNYKAFTESEVSSLVFICNKIIYSKINSYHFKINAIKILINLKTYLNNFNIKISEFNEDLIINNSFNPFEEYDYNSSRFIVSFSNFFLQNRTIDIIYLLPFFINSNENEQYCILRFIRDLDKLLVKKDDFTKFLCMIYKISYSSDNYHIKYLTILLIINVLKYTENQALSELLLDGFLYGNFEIKYLISSNLFEYKRDINIESLEEKIRLDKSELIRSIIKDMKIMDL